MKNAVILLLLLAAAFPVLASSDSDIYCPINESGVWVYDLLRKHQNERVRDVKVEITGRNKLDGREYMCFYSPYSKGIYSVRKDDSGAYIKTMKHPLPFLSFINFDIEFMPEACFIKFPIKKGDSWEYRGQAALKALNIVDLRRDIYARFLVAGREKVNVMGKEINSYHVVLYADRGGGEEKLYRGELWFGENTGYVMGDTDDAHFELIQYYLRSDPGTAETAGK